MYIRKSTQLDSKTGKPYATYRLVESYRNSLGAPRQQTLLNLGAHFSIPEKDWKLLSDRIEAILQGQPELSFDSDIPLETEAQRIAKLVVAKGSVIRKNQSIPAQNQPLEDYQRVDVNSMTHQDVRFIGAESVGMHAATQLGLGEILRRTGLNDKQADVAVGIVVARLVAPGSELATHRYLQRDSALDELLGCDFSKVSLYNLYQAGDLLMRHKEQIEASLYRREVSLFNLEEVITLYDLTNTYFEGRNLSNAKAKMGRSKEKRNDCCLVALGMVLDASGFPKKSKIYEGNIGEPATLEEMLFELKGKAQKTTVVLDAGIASEANLKWLKEQGFFYIVVSRKHAQKAPIPEGAETVTLKYTKGNTVKGYLLQGIEESTLYCHSEAKEMKGTLMKNRFETRLEMELQKLQKGLNNQRGSSKKTSKILERIGRLKEKYSTVAKYYDINVIPQAEDPNTVMAVVYAQNAEKRQSNIEGIYCLRSNHLTLDAQTLWGVYTMLTELEAAFRHLKSELGLRPVYHQLEHRVDAHLFISILAYHLLHTIRYQLKEAGIHQSWQEIRLFLKSHIRLTTSFNCEEGRVLHIRKNSLPTVEQRKIYQALGMPIQALGAVHYHRQYDQK